jgi:hypothetical protein
MKRHRCHTCHRDVAREAAWEGGQLQRKEASPPTLERISPGYSPPE